MGVSIDLSEPPIPGREGAFLRKELWSDFREISGIGGGLWVRKKDGRKTGAKVKEVTGTETSKSLSFINIILTCRIYPKK